MQPDEELPRRQELLQPLQALVLPKRWGRDAMHTALEAALNALQASASCLIDHLLPSCMKALSFEACQPFESWPSTLVLMLLWEVSRGLWLASEAASVACLCDLLFSTSCQCSQQVC